MTASATLTMQTNDITLVGLFEFLQQNMVTKQELRDTETSLRQEMIQQKEEILMTVDQKFDDLKDEIITMTGEMLIHMESNLTNRIDHIALRCDRLDNRLTVVERKVASAT